MIHSLLILVFLWDLLASEKMKRECDWLTSYISVEFTTLCFNGNFIICVFKYLFSVRLLDLESSRLTPERHYQHAYCTAEAAIYNVATKANQLKQVDINAPLELTNVPCLWVWALIGAQQNTKYVILAMICVFVHVLPLIILILTLCNLWLTFCYWSRCLWMT